MKYSTTILVFVLVFLIGWAAGSFILLEPNIFLWTVEQRKLLTCISIFAPFVALVFRLIDRDFSKTYADAYKEMKELEK